MATLARKRLGQAAHFLDLAQQHSGDRKRFTTYFEAFVVFGRSVLHVLRTEVDVAGVFTCFAAEWSALGKEALPDFFRGTRDIVLKEGVVGTGTRAEYAVTFAATATVIATLTLEVHRADGTVERPVVEPPPAATTQDPPAEAAEVVGRYFFTEGPFKDAEVFGVARQYLDRLARAIHVAENCGV